MQNQKIQINFQELFENSENQQDLNLQKILEFLGKKLNFPDYYGQNLDAFIDCFAEFGEQYAEQKVDLEIELLGLQKILEIPNKNLTEEKIRDLLATFEDAAFSRDETFADLGKFHTKIIVN